MIEADHHMVVEEGGDALLDRPVVFGADDARRPVRRRGEAAVPRDLGAVLEDVAGDAEHPLAIGVVRIDGDVGRGPGGEVTAIGEAKHARRRRARPVRDRIVTVVIGTRGSALALAQTKLVDLVRENFVMTPRGIIESLKLRRPIFKKTAAFGHFGRTEPEFTWEATDKAATLRNAVGAREAVTV